MSGVIVSPYANLTGVHLTARVQDFANSKDGCLHAARMGALVLVVDGNGRLVHAIDKASADEFDDAPNGDARDTW